MSTPSGSGWLVDCKIGNVKVGHLINNFQWKSLVNGGYIIRVRLEDPYFNIFYKVIEDPGGHLLPTGRQYDRPTLVTFKVKWDNGIEGRERVALVSDMHCLGGDEFSGRFEFIAIDPISYYVNSGDASGKMYRGKIGGRNGVIYQVLRDYVPPNIGGYNVKFIVGETDDQPNNYWMMRQDPKTFIASLLDWSCPFTKHKTSWIVANGQEEGTLSIEIKESWTPNLSYPKPVPGSTSPMVMSYGGGTTIPTADIQKWEILMDNFISALDLKLVTSGMSTISGEYWDRIVDEPEQVVFAKDQNTNSKVNPTFSSREGFTKPKKDDRGWTHIVSVPEVYSAGDIGYPYDRYVDGRARQKFMEMLNLLMRIRVTVRGQPRLYDSTELGRTKVTLRWLRPNEDGGGTTPRFIDGDWLLYGWHHKMSTNTGTWFTDLYLARLDWNASAIPGNG